MRHIRSGIIFSMAGLMLSCGGYRSVNTLENNITSTAAYAPSQSASGALLVRNPRPAIAPMQGGNFSSFEGWKVAFRQRALASGISPNTLASAEPYMTFHQRVVSNDRSQAEFKTTIMDYVNKRVIPARYNQGRAQWAKLGGQIRAISQAYGVDESVLMGIWGMETNFGSYTGSTNVFTSMSTLSYEGRRRNWAEKQLINALHIVQSGDISAANMTGSWASGLGHTQFIPEMFNIYAVDYNRDGRRDVWHPIEALASTANFLRNEGWRPGIPWGAEVSLPQGFDDSLAGKRNFQSPQFWRSKGVTARSSRGLPNAEFAIYIPEGSNGRAFAVTRNFEQIKRYNPSNSYILAVSILGDVTLRYSQWN